MRKLLLLLLLLLTSCAPEYGAEPADIPDFWDGVTVGMTRVVPLAILYFGFAYCYMLVYNKIARRKGNYYSELTYQESLWHTLLISLCLMLFLFLCFIVGIIP